MLFSKTELGVSTCKYQQKDDHNWLLTKTRLLMEGKLCFLLLRMPGEIPDLKEFLEKHNLSALYFTNSEAQAF